MIADRALLSFSLDHKVSVEPTLCKWGQSLLYPPVALQRSYTSEKTEIQSQGRYISLSSAQKSVLIRGLL